MNYIEYCRVSTRKQQKSGLGLEAQQAAVERFAMAGEIVGRYVETESGRRDDRPQLDAALKHCRRAKATLLVAKLDRLGRDVHLISGLMKSGVPFVCVDRPDADPFRLHIEAAIAEEEARKISTRTKESLAAYKARGGLLDGSRPECRNLGADARQRGGATTRANAVAAYADIAPTIKGRRAAGESLSAIAAWLNTSGRLTVTGCS